MLLFTYPSSRHSEHNSRGHLSCNLSLYLPISRYLQNRCYIYNFIVWKVPSLIQIYPYYRHLYHHVYHLRHLLPPGHSPKKITHQFSHTESGNTVLITSQCPNALFS